MTIDPTAIPIHVDPLQQRMRGVAIHGNTPFDVPFVSHIEGNLYMGGCQTGLWLPSNIEHVVSLYPWERYEVPRGQSLHSFREFAAYDGSLDEVPRINEIVEHVVECLEEGPTLVHCQAGLNRSGLICALVLMRQGRTAAEAIRLLREKRSPAVLCNREFEKWLLAEKEATE